MATATKRRKPEASDNPHEIELRDVGPHKHLRLVAPPGEITVLRGRNGAGKTQALQAVEALQNGRAKMTTRDGALGGHASGLGVVLTIGRGGANRRTGEVLVESVEDRMNVADFVDPQVKDLFAKDERRIRALITLAGAEPDVSLFVDGLIPGDGSLDEKRREFDEIVPAETQKLGDIVPMAAGIKRAFDAAARKVESEAENIDRDIDAKKQAIEGIDLKAPHDEAELSLEREQAVQKLARLRTSRQAGLEAEDRAKLARQKIEQAKAEHGGPTIEEADNALLAAASALNAQAATVADLADRLRAARETLALREQEKHAAEAALNAARDHQEAMAGWEETVAAGIQPYPTAEEIDAAEQECQAARLAEQQGTRIRDALSRAAQIDAQKAALRRLTERANALRDAGKSTDAVLSRLVETLGVPLRVDEQFRLVAKHPVRGECYFDELSMGEKWRVALVDVAVPAFNRLGAQGLLTIPQEAWESLDADNRRQLAEIVAQTEISVITAEAAQDPDELDGSLHVDTYGGE